MPATRFILIDDDYLSCFIAEKLIASLGMKHAVRSFLDPFKAMDYIRNNKEDKGHAVLMVDLKMPMMNGFEFIEAFELLPREVKNKCSIYILSSSINQTDQVNAMRYASVKRFICKPLTTTGIQQILEETRFQIA